MWMFKNSPIHAIDLIMLVMNVQRLTCYFYEKFFFILCNWPIFVIYALFSRPSPMGMLFHKYGDPLVGSPSWVLLFIFINPCFHPSLPPQPTHEKGQGPSSSPLPSSPSLVAILTSDGARRSEGIMSARRDGTVVKRPASRAIWCDHPHLALF